MNTLDTIGSFSGINRLSGLTELKSFNQEAAEKAEKENLFGSFFEAALKVYEDTNLSQVESQQMYVDLATGKTDDILAVILAQERAAASFSFTAQVTGRVIEAYREIMRIQI